MDAYSPEVHPSLTAPPMLGAALGDILPPGAAARLAALHVRRDDLQALAAAAAEDTYTDIAQMNPSSERQSSHLGSLRQFGIR